MARIAYVDGQFAPVDRPAVLVEDRGYQFSDGVYEVCIVVDGRMWDADGHFARWRRSLAELRIPEPMSERAMRAVAAKLLRKNRLRNALVYMQASRGISPRNHVFGREGAPVLVMTARPFNLAASDRAASVGVKVVSAEDIRWRRVDIKSISLLPNILAKTVAKSAGAVEAWLVKEGVVTEGASSNAWIVDGSGGLVTHPLGEAILGGITRASVKACAEEMGRRVEERPFTLEEAMSAQEAFMTSATSIVTPIVQIDDARIGDGAPGPVAMALRQSYMRRCAA